MVNPGTVARYRTSDRFRVGQFLTLRVTTYSTGCAGFAGYELSEHADFSDSVVLAGSCFPRRLSRSRPLSYPCLLMDCAFARREGGLERGALACRTTDFKGAVQGNHPFAHTYQPVRPGAMLGGGGKTDTVVGQQ